ncbi:hypothetical protein GOBAR_AA00027 [Gossypium barbadense]|uniref:Uncharacterized protein n=2 Tax=Gossypium TaxID=3633 RepID=A0A2P5YYA7_GOSBA|nr:hypothetical protein GOBAR_AA00027 [Gossypium barbadense]TYG99505.1 hypothetical protein ES288_A10G200300v1 [Gossypium darwinii]
MASHYPVLNNHLPKDFTQDFCMLDELYRRPPPGRASVNRRAPPSPSPSQYPHELSYQQTWMGFRNQVFYHPRERYVITSTEAAQIYGGTLLNDLPKQKT